MRHPLSIIVAMGKNRQIGLEGKIPWHLPEELAHFKKLTEHHRILMGRKTFESLGRLLPHRHHIVITNNPKTGIPDELEFWPALTHGLSDYVGRELKAKGECYYTISSAGHEINAAFGAAFELKDMAFLHYRSGGFFQERSRKLPGTTPIFDTLLSLKASVDEPIAGGRHKVWGV